MTEDQLDRSEQSLTSKSAADRVEEQLDLLLSDMQAFKAANPDAKLGDFVRWHSPRDWIDAGDGRGGRKRRASRSACNVVLSNRRALGAHAHPEQHVAERMGARAADSSRRADATFQRGQGGERSEFAIHIFAYQSPFADHSRI